MPTWTEPRRPLQWRADLMPVTLTKRPTEVRDYEFEFAQFPELIAGQTLTGTPTVSASGSGLTVGSPSRSGSKVVVQLSSGTDGTSYRLTCTCGTSGSKTLVALGDLLVTTEPTS